MTTLPNSNTPATLPLTIANPPSVFFKAEAWRKVQYIVQSCAEEVAWMGFVDELEGGDYLITEVFIPKQQVTGTSVDADAFDISKICFDLIQQGKDTNKLRYHGHSHVNMGVSPSTTDQNHMEEWLEPDDCDWFIRSIQNKKGEMKVDVFDKRTGFTHQCVSTAIWETLQTEEWYAAVDAEIKKNVTKKTYTPKTHFFWDSKPSNINETSGVTKDELIEEIVEFLLECDEKERNTQIAMLLPEERAAVIKLLGTN